MANSEVPSFSLGLDTPPHSPFNPPPSPTAHVSDSELDTRADPPRPLLKRIRRGPPSPSLDADVDDDIEEFSSQEDPDQVHTLLSASNRSVCSSSKISLNGSRVFSLTPHHCSNSSRDGKRKEHSDDVPASSRLETGKSGLMFPKLTTSPLRRFQLIDSDDSDVDVGGGANNVNPNDNLKQDKKLSFDDNKNVDLWKDFSPLKNDSVPEFRLIDSDSDVDVGGDNKVYFNNHLEKNKKAYFDKNRNDSLWKDFSPVKNVSVPTPAFNELCEEYFRSNKCKEVRGDVNESHNERYPGVSSSCQRNQQQWESVDLVYPAHKYFFHEDPRIQQLVHTRFRNFNPLGAINRVNQQPNTSHIDYMGQFGNGRASNTQGVQNACVNGSTRGKNTSSNLVFEGSFNTSEGWVDPKIVSPFSHGESSRKKATKRNSTKNSVSKGKGNKSSPANQSRASGDWVEPRSCASSPKDAGKRRVQASGQSAGHWYTSPEGRKVYVNKSGQELTGRSAYVQYRKESGTVFNKSKKKTGSKTTKARKKRN
ncbi:hypothetical protein LR48_Vigan07g022200 [Vigna angularis]|uniref:Uncharacterized protein n=2 Tax=Phaseolus angularis TaxID=3914 RepID=A0A0L9UUU8_PHAAN|nr:uncharacterized protein LOC108337132 [Vigna angularis]KOM46518.1 hypothetical protein LR48_Vigan07g022200 [Vigna angularis]BAT80718.1 hypothetical protein VIGAN_03031700 [Vigna angularis var. angularis]